MDKKNKKTQICATCGKKLGFFKYQPIWTKKSFCSLKCLREDKRKNPKEERKMRSKGMIKEIKCECNQCGKVWHYLEEDEKKLRSQATNNALLGCSFCCNPIGALFSNKSIDLQRELDKMKKCPSCNSADITKTMIYHEKKT